MGTVLRWGLFLSLVGGIVYIALKVDLTPKVESDFFFATDPKGGGGEDPFQKTPAQVILSLEAADLASPEYLERVRALAAELSASPGVVRTIDVAHGPKDYADAKKSPFWGRFLLSEDGLATQMIVFVDGNPREVVPRLEGVVARHQRPDFRIAISGVPYVVEHITQSLFRDLKSYMIVTLVVFSVLVLFLFRSWSILAGALVTCLGSSVATLGIQFAVGVRPGILTGNILTITFVLALSHIVFLAGNWSEGGAQVGKAVRDTAMPSFWSAATTLAGFLSLLLATAKPLREFAVWGAVGCGVSMVVAYTVFPLYLKVARPGKLDGGRLGFAGRPHLWGPLLVLALFGISIYGFRRINHDPSLVSYFRPGSDIRRGIEAIDARSGSTPYELVISEKEAPPLTNAKSIAKLQKLQEELEKDPAVGQVVSLPTLLGEVDRRIPIPIPVESKIKYLEKPEAYEIGRYFITKDRRHTRFMLRMRESRDEMRREETIRRIEATVKRHGYDFAYTQGLFKQMGELSGLVIGSVYRGLVGLLVLFAGVSFLVARSLRAAFAMIYGLCAVAACTLGIAGVVRMPLDIISSTAVNVAIGVGIDGMIHLVTHLRRTGETWAQARVRMAFPVLVNAAIVAGGFAIFSLSSFPPTQRFGLLVILGVVLAAFVVLFVLPFPFARVEAAARPSEAPRP